MEAVSLEGDRLAWFDEAYRAHRDAVFRTCMRFAAGDRAWAMDRTHDVFVKLAESIDTVQGTDDPGGWLYRVSVNTCFMAIRRRGIWQRISDTLSGSTERTSPSAHGQIEARQVLGRFEQALLALPPKQRAVVVLVELEGKSQKEAAELLTLSKGQVSKLRTRALEALKAVRDE